MITHLDIFRNSSIHLSEIFYSSTIPAETISKTQLIPFLTQQELDNQAKIGKVSFGTIYSDKKADPGKAVANAIQCWEDGLVRVFMNEEELTDMDAPLTIEAQSVLTFIRLTFLAGSVW